MDNDIQKAVQILKEGGIVIFPTDTAFGIGCRIDNESSLKRLFEIRKRPETKATPVLVDTVKMAQEYLQPIPKDVIDKLIEPYWPGALTIILYCNIVKVPKLVRGNGSTLGVRIPNHPIARALIREMGVPILGPSANFAGGKTPFAFEDLDKELVQLVDYVVSGDCTVKKASTVVDCTQKPWKVLREGAVFIKGRTLIQGASLTQRALLIDTSSNQQIIVGLKINGKEFKKTKKIGKQKAQVVLPLIDQILKKHNLTVQDLTAVEVNTGPGSFTGLRVGISVANALALSLKIPINNLPVGKFVEPVYE